VCTAARPDHPGPVAGPRRTTDAARSDMHDALADGRQRRGGPPARPSTGPQALLALQRFAGNSAVSALMTARLKWPGEQARSDIDGALRELRRDEPVIDTVEKGLKAAQAAGVPVELEGPKPPPSALAVKTTGFGPESVAPKKPVPPPKPVPAKHPLGKAAARAPHPGGHAAGSRPAPIPTGSGAAATAAPAPLPADKLLQPPAPPTHVRPEGDPHFTRVTKSVAGFAHAKKSHAPAHAKATEAQAAALPPTDDLAGQAKAAKVDTMDAQHPGSFDKKAFIASVKAAIEAKSPKNLKEAADYKESGKAGEVKGEIKSLVGEGKEGQAKDFESATAAPPDQSKAVPKPVTPMSEEQAGQPVPIPADGAVPKPAPPEQVNLAAGKHEADQQMAEGDVTDQQLAESNEPQFQQALGDKQTAAAHADTAPAQYRQQEQEVIGQGKADATAQTTAGVAGMQGSKGAAIAHLVAHKAATKSKDEAKRAEVTGRIQAIFTAAEADVKKILDGIDPKVEAAFEAGEKDARTAFESYVAAKMAAYKEDRYSGWLGGLRWAKDKLFGMPDKVNEFFTAGREIYLQRMDGVISRVADIVGGDLTAAKQRIAKGKADIATYVTSLPRDLQKVGTQATKEIGDRFAQLENDVNAKQESVVDTLATKYVDARKVLDERIEELQAENKGLVDKAISAIKAVVGTIRDLINMLTNVLARVASVVGDIVKHPVRFLGNLIDGIKGGILKFKDNIVDHLRKGLMGWLFGALASAGVELPDTFDLKGIIKLLASIFGLTWANIRNRIVKKIGEKAMGVAEKGVGIFQTIASQGIGGLWQMFVEKLGDIKEMILEQAKDFVVTKIITAGITWLIGLLNPAAAFIKACKLIYDIVMFFVDNAERIAKFVNTVLDSVADVVRGNISAVVSKIEDVLGQMVPIIIGFLASVIGLGGIGEKIHAIIHALQKPVNKALDFIVSTGLKLAGPLIRGIAGISGKVKAKAAAGKAWAKGKVEAGKTFVKGKVEAGKAAVRSVVSGIPAAFGFRAGGESHRVWIDKAGRVMVASTEEEGRILLQHFQAAIAEFPARTEAEQRRCTDLGRKLTHAQERLANLDSVKVRPSRTQRQVEKAQESFGRSLSVLFTGIHAERMRLAGKVPKYVTPGLEKSAGPVKCVAVITVSSTSGQQPYPTGRGGGPVGTDPAREAKTTETPPRVAHGTEYDSPVTGQVGGYVLESPAATESREHRAHIVTRATGDEAPATHAEARLFAQVRRMSDADPDWRSRVRTLEVHISHSPCPACADALMGLHAMVENDNLRVSILSWGTRYTSGKYPTNPSDIPRLGSKYSVNGP
jgi:hypothetical protein